MAKKRVCQECKERTPTGGDMLCDECRTAKKVREDSPPAGTVLPGDPFRAGLNSAIRQMWLAMADAHDAGLEITPDDLAIWGAVTKHKAIQDRLKGSGLPERCMGCADHNSADPTACPHRSLTHGNQAACEHRRPR